MSKEAELIDALEVQYGATANSLHLLGDGDKEVYRINHAGEPDWILRVRPFSTQSYNVNAFQNMATTLLFLAHHGYPAERVIRATNGDSVVHHQGWELLVTTYQGESLQAWLPASGVAPSTGSASATLAYRPETLAALAAALGKLHNLPVKGNTSIPIAGMLPENELTFAASRLNSVDGRLSEELRSEYKELAAAIKNIDRCKDLDAMLIHNDPNLGNVVRKPDGSLALIDWDVAGLGPAVIDLGVLLNNCQPVGHGPNSEAINAVVEAYCQYRVPLAQEMANLLDAMRFQTLVLLAASFPDRVSGELTDDQLLYGATYPEWQANYTVAEELAEVARTRFERYL